MCADFGEEVEDLAARGGAGDGGGGLERGGYRCRCPGDGAGLEGGAEGGEDAEGSAVC